MIFYGVVRWLGSVRSAGYNGTLYRNVLKERYGTVQYIAGCVVCSVLRSGGVLVSVGVSVCDSCIAYVQCDRVDGDVKGCDVVSSEGKVLR
jgi:hypothetical protein